MSKKKLVNTLIAAREKAGSIDSFNETRCKLLNGCSEVKEDSNGILYWMQRDCRVQDNWAMIFAQRMANKCNVPLHVCFFSEPIKDLYPTLRQYEFLIDGLREVAEELRTLSINFYLINDKSDSILDIIKNNNIGGLICEFNPLKCHKNSVENIKTKLPEDVPFVQVDAHNVVPCLVASVKQEIAARTIRSKINKKLEEYLVEFPQILKHEYVSKALKVTACDFDSVIEINKKHFDDKIKLPKISWAIPGYKNGISILEHFLDEKLKNYDKCRNDPSLDGQSNLSPWLHFGQISAQRCAFEAKKNGKIAESFIEELVVRKELADNYCYYNEHYDSLKGADNWAQITLNAHRKDKRDRIYTQEQFAESKTHDTIWNAAQKQLVNEGKLHGYMRMYWCKKILEWTETPEDAISIGLYLNDTYSLDGSDPNGFVGVMWSICGIHDHGWKERPIFGKIRFMVDYSLEKKYDIKEYKRKYGGNGNNVSVKRVKK